ncbi:uncharacterized protein M437DRAFT_62775 [Aureobasidium melanogenum CBS 110374]|uniref:Uncharacterized protein n=1 Tax=Aureobasidium melanogenum (strain CBS 110374) TaxID=1043003 RepID=A0A074W1C3_AURM1|nr:uncharacterized protein M437DRAFT_62775 [Aureobasidium melanogenum CBS 110374]KEQ66583.1 hypothetical protein M437DRAFT_62775 [Aureobasidium melanogenum CBS 110374]
MVPGKVVDAGNNRNGAASPGNDLRRSPSGRLVDGESSTDTTLTTRREYQQSDRHVNHRAIMIQQRRKWASSPSNVTAPKPNSQSVSQSHSYYSLRSTSVLDRTAATTRPQR